MANESSRSDEKLLKDILNSAYDGNFVTYQCAVGFHCSYQSGCPGYNMDAKGNKYPCNCECHEQPVDTINRS